MRDGATVQPALLARGLRRVALERGVVIHEQSRVRPRLERDGPRKRALLVDGRAGRIGSRPARWCLRECVGRRMAAIPSVHPGLGQLHGPFGADPEDRLAELGWTGGESIYTARFNVEYFQVTRDRRIAIGSGGGVPGYDGRIGPSFTDDLGSARRAATAFRTLFPQLADVPLTDAWGGPIDVSGDHLPRFGTLKGGACTTRWATRAMAWRHRTWPGACWPPWFWGPMSRSRGCAWWVRRRIGCRRSRPLPWCARVIRRAIMSREAREMQGRRAPWWLRQLTALPRRLGFHLGPSA